MWFWMFMGCQSNSGLAPMVAGGTAERPWVLASSTVIDNASHQRALDDPDTTHIVQRQRLGETAASATLELPAGSRVVGVHGDRVWLLSGKEPLLVDADAGRFVFGPRALGDRHATLAEGATATGFGHPDFVGNVHRPTGGLGVTTKGFKGVLTLSGDLVPLDTFLAQTKTKLPTGLTCRGGRRTVCGTSVCMKTVADPSGGERVVFSGSIPEASSEPLFGPEPITQQGCVEQLSSGLIAVSHRSGARRGPWDRVSAVKQDGTVAWTVSRSDLYGDLDTAARAQRLDLVGESVVAASNVSDLWSGGARLAIARVDAKGEVTQAR